MSAIDIDDIDETDLDDVDLVCLDLAEIFIAFGISSSQALEVIKERYPVIHIQLMSESDTLH
jgi:hypothetical protein